MNSALGYGVQNNGGLLLAMAKSTSSVHSVAAQQLAHVTNTAGTPVIFDYIMSKNNATWSWTHTWKYFLFATWKHEYTITINGVTKTYLRDIGQDVGGYLIINNTILIDDFGLSVKDATHQVHDDIFNSIDDTALAWSLKYYAASNNPNDRREYGSAIYEHGGGYSFGAPNIAQGSSAAERMSVTIPSAPSGYTMVTGIHSHPNEPKYSVESFSSRNEFGQLDGDYLWVQRNGVPLYLATPSGKIKVATSRDRSKQSFNVDTVFKGINW